eukprot:7022588-Pyramimonas_sp.AAC.1
MCRNITSLAVTSPPRAVTAHLSQHHLREWDIAEVRDPKRYQTDGVNDNHLRDGGERALLHARALHHEGGEPRGGELHRRLLLLPRRPGGAAGGAGGGAGAPRGGPRSRP